MFENLCLACPYCNRHKSDHQTAIDPQSFEVVRFFNPQKQVWTKHFAWNENGKKIKGLSATGRTTIAALQMNRPALVRARAMWVKLGEHPPYFD